MMSQENGVLCVLKEEDIVSRGFSLHTTRKTSEKFANEGGSASDNFVEILLCFTIFELSSTMLQNWALFAVVWATRRSRAMLMICIDTQWKL